MKRRIITSARLMTDAAEGKVSKHGMANMLAARPRGEFLRACAKIERQFTVECGARNGPCVEAGCADEGEICVAPLIRAGREYYKACAVPWSRLFEKARNRSRTWEASAASLD